MNEVITTADAAASTRAASSLSPPSLLPTNICLLSAFIALTLAQFLKLFTACGCSDFEFQFKARKEMDGFVFARKSCPGVAREGYLLGCDLELVIRYKEKRWDSRRILSSGGMPSSHSATVMALTVAIALQEGTSGPAFAIAVVLACVVMYDATGVRLHAGRQAELLNQIVCELPSEHPLSNVRPLRDSLGHTPVQVLAGAVLGCIVAFLLRKTQ